MATLPQGVGISAPLEYVDLPTNTFIIDWSTRQIAGTGSGLPAMRQAVEIILNVENVFGGRYTAVTSVWNWKAFLVSIGLYSI